MAAEYPLSVVYCPSCSLPPEFCEFSVKYEKCKPWLTEHYPQYLNAKDAAKLAAGAVPSTTPAAVAGAGAGTADATAPKVAAEGDAGVTLAKMSLEETKKVKFEGDGSDDGSDEGKKKTKRGGGVIRGGPGAKAGGKKGDKAGIVTIMRKDRGRGKHVTIIRGLDAFGIKPKEAASALGKKFGTGASATKAATGEPEIDVQGDLVYEISEALEALFGISEDCVVIKD